MASPVKHLWCALRGHQDDVHLEPGRLAVECRHCGRVTTGVEIGPPRVRDYLPGLQWPQWRARALQRAWLAWTLMEREG